MASVKQRPPWYPFGVRIMCLSSPTLCVRTPLHCGDCSLRSPGPKPLACDAIDIDRIPDCAPECGHFQQQRCPLSLTFIPSPKETPRTLMLQMTEALRKLRRSTMSQMMTSMPASSRSKRVRSWNLFRAVVVASDSFIIARYGWRNWSPLGYIRLHDDYVLLQVLFHLTLFTCLITMGSVGGIVGTGLFSTPSSILGSVGSVGASLMLWVLGLVLSFCGLFVWLELGTMIPRSGGEKVYLEAVYRRPKGLATVLYATKKLLLNQSSANCIVCLFTSSSNVLFT